MVAGLEEVTEGKIVIGDRLVNDVSPKDRGIAMAFQSYALYPHMNVYDNLVFGLKMRKFQRAEIDRRVKEAAGILGIEVLLGWKPLGLYQGRKVILGIRPEHLGEMSQEETEATGEIAATVEVVEMMGPEQVVYLVVRGKSFVAKMDGSTRVRVGDVVKLAFPKEKIHLFDRETEKSIANLTQR
ncbi:MAG: TOBE domain-containing protein [Chloroflexi bacterium]|nr:TOBE domain-containing protein [Chloroflexota bacterium]